MALNGKETEKFPEPFPYGVEFDSIPQLMSVVEERRGQNLQLYGHAVCWVDGMRIGARVNFLGDITVGVHCENI